MIELKKCEVRWDKENYVPRKVHGFQTKAMKGTPRKIAETFLKENRQSLKLSVPLSSLRFEKAIESLGATTVLFQQHFEGAAIHGAWISVHIDKKKRIFMVKNGTVSVAGMKDKLKGKKTKLLPHSKIDKIIKRKAKEHGTLDTEIEKESMIYALKGDQKEVWKVKFGTKKPAGSWIIFIDKTDGQILDERSVLRKAVGKGLVFKPNPVVALDNSNLYDKKDKDQSIFKKAYRKVKLHELGASGYLKGPYVDTTNTPGCANAANLDFRCKRQDDRFEEVMAYYHIDTLQRYIQSLGFKGSKGILVHPIKVNAHGTSDDQSYYDPSPGKHDLTFGDGGVDDAEDADIIVHEYGHAIQDNIVPGFGQHTEGRAMGEGFGDYLAASFFYKFRPKSRKEKIAEWDAKGFQGEPQECLRWVNSDKHYPEDMVGEEHVDGEIWSACLWKVRKLLGSKKADTIILESHFYLNQYSDFRDGAEAIIMAEENLFNGWRIEALRKIFKDRGIL